MDQIQEYNKETCVPFETNLKLIFLSFTFYLLSYFIIFHNINHVRKAFWQEEHIEAMSYVSHFLP